MIVVKIPKDIREYQEKIIGGLSLRQIIVVIICIAVAVPVFYVFGGYEISINNVGTIAQDLGFIGMPILAPIIIFGFVKFNSLTAEQLLAGIIKFCMSKRRRKFVSENVFRKLEKEYDKSEKAGSSAKIISLDDAHTASFERTYLMQTARENGEKIDVDKIKLVTVKTSPPPKKKKDDNNNPSKNKKSKAEIQLAKTEKKAKDIIAKQTENPMYVFTKYERAVVKSYNVLVEKCRVEKIKTAVKKVAAKNETIKKRRFAPSALPDTVQKTLPYIADYDNGLFEVDRNVYNKVYELNDINYSSMKTEEQESVVAKYSEFLNSFSEEVTVAVTLDNRIVSKNEQENKIFYPLVANDDFDKHRREYNKIMRRQMEAGRNNIVLSKYLTVSVKSATPVEAMERFHKIDNEVLTGLEKIGAGGRLLTTDERLSMLHDRFRRGREGELKIDYDFLKLQGISSKDYVAPASFCFMPKYFMIEDEYYRCMFLANLPSTLDDSFFMELADNDFPTTVNMSILPVAQEKGLKMVKKKLQGIEANKVASQKQAIKGGYSPDMISHSLEQSHEEAKDLMEDMSRKNQKMFFVTFTIMISAGTFEELQERYKILQSKARKQTSQIITIDFQQEDAFRVTVPGGLPPSNLYFDRALTSDATAIFVPYSCQEMFQSGGFYYGINRISRNLILLNRSVLLTPSGFILGSSGSGKSFAAKREMLNVLLRDIYTTLIIIDPENEYHDFIEAFGGVSMKISADTDNFINPMEMTEDYGLDNDDDNQKISLADKKKKALQCKSEYIMSIVQCMMGDVITAQHKTLIDRCVRACYAEYLEHNFDSEYLPTLLELQGYFDKEAEESTEAKQVAQATEYYTKGSLNVFSHKSNVDLHNRAVAFNIRDLGDQLKQIALLIVLDFVWNRMIENFGKGLQTYCYVDEIHVLFRNEYSANFLRQLYKRGRKYGLVITGITQDIDDLLKSDTAKGMINNSDFLLLLNQSSENVRVLSETLHLSEMQATFIDDVEAGCGLIRAKKVIVPFVDRFPTDSPLYDLMSTNFNERMEREREAREERENKNNKMKVEVKV